MLRRLPATFSRSYTSFPTGPGYVRFQPEHGLRVLFCGADEFSFPSLRALNDARLNNPSLIESIYVVHRKGKYTGRGLTTLKDAPIRAFAHELKLETIARENFNLWKPPEGINIVIAVSFGLLIPWSVLGRCPYGGLNVHPSLLPDLHGAAPIERAILRKRKTTGVTVQTLHPSVFDKGTRLAQTPAPGILIGNKTGPQLKAELAEIGAKMLMEVLESGKHNQPHKDAGWYQKDQKANNSAPKITKQDTRFDFQCDVVDNGIVKVRAMGGTWVILPNTDRLIIHEMVDTGKTDPTSRIPGIYVQKGHKYPLLRDLKGGIAEIKSSTYDSKPANEGNKELFRIFKHEEGKDELLTDK